MNNLTTSKSSGYLINKFLKTYLAKDNDNCAVSNMNFVHLEDVKFKYTKLLLRNQELQYNVNDDNIKKC